MKPLQQLFKLLPLLAVIVAWEACAYVSASNFVPHIPTLIKTVLQTFWGDAMIAAQGGGIHGYAGHIFSTLKSFLVCLLCGVISGFALAVTVFQWPLPRRILGAVVAPWEIIPPLIAIPIGFAVAGLAWTAQFFAGAFYAFVASSVFTTAALRNVPQSYVSLARIGGAKSTWIAWNVYVPAALPHLIGPLKVTASFLLGIIVIVEFFSAPAGIGRVMKFAISYNSIELLLAGVVWAVLLGFSFDMCVERLAKLFLRWAPRTKPGAGII